MKKFIKITLLGLLFFCPACSFNTGSQETISNNFFKSPSYPKSGMIAIAESIPQEKSELTSNMLSFLSTNDEIKGNWILINTTSNTLSIKKGDETLSTIAIKENVGIQPGIYSVFHKELNPLWYASDNYYYSRELTPPDQFSQERYVKGALGDCAIYLNEHMAIHDSKISSFDVQGIRIDSNDIKKLYSSLKSGDLIKVY